MTFFGMVTIITLALIAAFCFVYWLEYKETKEARNRHQAKLSPFEFSHSEWKALTFDEKEAIWDNYWKTRDETEVESKTV